MILQEFYMENRSDYKVGNYIKYRHNGQLFVITTKYECYSGNFLFRIVNIANSSISYDLITPQVLELFELAPMAQVLYGNKE